MLYEIKKLTTELADDYIEFFDNSAYSDGSEFAGCYCTYYHWNDECEKKFNNCCESKKNSFKKELAYNWILEGKLNGFLVYYEGKPIAWCNANNKQSYEVLRKENNPEIWVDSSQEDKALSIVCILVDPKMRGKGVASTLLKEICNYAEKENYKYIEAYPTDKEFSTLNYHGQYSTYQKLGFELIGNSKLGLIMRKYFNS